MDYRVAHFALVGMTPKFARFKEILALTAQAGYNAVMLELENVFPWRTDALFRSKYAFSEEQLTELVDNCTALNLEIIPLMQSFGHLENILRHSKYSHLRETPEGVMDINPLADETPELLAKLVAEVLGFFPRSKFIHLGGDEVWTLGSNAQTKSYIAQHGREKLYLHHILPLCRQIAATGKRVILWHDMMVNWASSELQQLSEYGDLMVWGYGGSPLTTTDIQHHHIDTIRTFINAGVPVWGAGAFKGAEGGDRDMIDCVKRRENVIGWRETSEVVALRGLAMTGWSRYCSAAMQCESLEASLPSLLMAGKILNRKDVNFADALAELRTMPNFEDSEDIFQTAQSFQEARDEQWRQFRIFRYNNGALAENPQLYPGVANSMLKWVGLATEQANVAGQRFHDLLYDKVELDCLDEYVNGRLRVVRDVQNELDSFKPDN